MSQPPSAPTWFPPAGGRWTGVPLALVLAAAAHAQDAARPLTVPDVSAPSGYDTVPGYPGTDFADALDGLSYGLGSTLYYDSNVLQGGGGPRDPVVDDMILTLSPYIAYENPGGDVTFGGRFSLDHLTYFENSDLGGLGYSGSLNAGYQGGKFRFTGSLSSSLVNGANRNFNNAFVETLNFNSNLGLTYILSPKTSINSRFAYGWSEPSGNAFGTTYRTSFDTAALWQATPLVTVGPGIGWSLDGGDRQPDRQAIGPILRLGYKLSTKVALDSTFGFDFVDQGGGGDDTTFNARVAASYRASAMWGMNLSLYRGTTANGGFGGGFRETTSVRLGYVRKIRRAALNTGVSYEVSDLTGAGVGGGDERDYVNFDMSVGMPVFYRRATAAVFYNWRSESGSGRSWDGYRLGLSLSSSF